MKINGRKYLDANYYNKISVVSTNENNIRCNITGKQDISTIKSNNPISKTKNKDDKQGILDILDYFLRYNKVRRIEDHYNSRYNLTGILLISENDKEFFLSIPKTFEIGQEAKKKIFENYKDSFNIAFYDEKIQNIEFFLSDRLEYKRHTNSKNIKWLQVNIPKNSKNYTTILEMILKKLNTIGERGELFFATDSFYSITRGEYVLKDSYIFREDIYCKDIVESFKINIRDEKFRKEARAFVNKYNERNKNKNVRQLKMEGF